ncbi:copper resistance CopC family protein [Tateyamaria sp. SN3-11]|uniref:copper resistance CopC family protein n=1 Tax=Tateyamaria sp. SN3-11 TaxID=3092147 RepID=UPI0039EA9DF3
MKYITRAALLLVWATSALAHSPLQATTPADGAAIAQAPSEIVLDFKGNIRLTRVTVAHADQPGADLDLGEVSGFRAGYALPMAPMGAGTYVIEWRGLGDDGHPMNGAFSFTVED